MKIRTCRTLRAHLIKQRAKGVKWCDIGPEFPDAPLGTLCRIAKDPNYEPHSKRIRIAIGLRSPMLPRRKYDLSEREARAIGARLYIAI